VALIAYPPGMLPFLCFSTRHPTGWPAFLLPWRVHRWPAVGGNICGLRQFNPWRTRGQYLWKCPGLPHSQQRVYPVPGDCAGSPKDSRAVSTWSLGVNTETNLANMSISCATFDAAVSCPTLAGVGGPTFGSARAAEGSTSTWRETPQFLCM